MTLMTEDAIAVVGMACRFPGAADVRQYWAALRAGAEGISRFDRDRLVADGADPREVCDPGFVPAKGVMAGSRNFDWQFFGYSLAEAASIDPQQRVFLECASAAIDDAGLDPGRFAGWIGVYAGADRVAPRGDRDLSEMARFIGEEKDFLASRVAYKLGLRGPALTVQTACSTSLASIHLAAQSLLCRECDAALAGGVAVLPRGQWGYRYQPGGILSPDGYCRPFDERAAGTVPSEGVGVVVLKRVRDAIRDGDRIAAVILGSAFNNDGSGKLGFTAPSIAGQAEVIQRAHKAADVDPADLGYIEAHGTATQLGDPVEVEALTDAFRTSTDATGFCWLGAVKSNIGHTGAAAGVAGLIKTVLMLDHQELVPTLHFTKPNPLLDLDATPFRVCAAAQPWPGPRRALAGVSSFGLGGTNAHVVLAGAPRRSPRPACAGPRLLALSAASADALGTMREQLAGRLAGQADLEQSDPERADLDLADVARTLAERRRFARRQAFVASGLAEAADLIGGAPDPAAPRPLRRVAFLFPGQGTLTGAAGAAPYRCLAGFRGYFDELRRVIEAVCGVDLRPVVTGSGASADWFLDTVHQQLGLFALGCALGRQLADWGVKPAALLGNSVGEYAAAVIAGLWTAPDAARLVYHRARAMWDTAPGRMAAVRAPEAEVRRRIGPWRGVTIAVSAPGTTVISGGERSMDELLGGAALRGLEVSVLEVSRAFHSPEMDQAAEAVRAAAADVPSRRPQVPLLSNVTGYYADPDVLRTADYWARHLRQPVLLDAAVSTLLGSDCDTFVELGPGTSMLGALRRASAWDAGHTAVPMLGRAGGEEHGLLRALAVLWERGANPVLDPGEAVRCSLPPHPFTARDPESGPDAAVPAPSGQGQVRAVPEEPGSVRQVLNRLWCAALGVASVADDDDFFALGGESMTVLDLLGRVREQTRLAISVTEFSRDATFGALVGLAEREQAPGTRPAVRVVTLAEGGTGRPLFLAADAAGNALSYQALVGALDVSRPVYGLEPAEGPRAPMTIQDNAAHHVAAVLRTQRSGPYTVGGWSFGAVLAHEMARQLTERGERVDLLLCLDAVPLGRRKLPLGLDPGFWAGAVWLRACSVLGIGAVGRRARRDPGLRDLLMAKARDLARYRPGPVGCPAVVFKAGIGAGAAARLQDRLCAQYGGGARVFPAGGDHWTMLAAPHVQELAAALRGLLPDGQED